MNRNNTFFVLKALLKHKCTIYCLYFLGNTIGFVYSGKLYLSSIKNICNHTSLVVIRVF